MHRLAPVLLFLALACRDTLAGPEAQRFGTAVADPWSDSSQARLHELWRRLGAQPLRPDAAHPGDPVSPRIDGESVAARALVFELAFEGQAPLPADCHGTRLTLIGWTLEPVPQGLIITGGDFAQPVAPPAQCEGRLLPTRQPAATLRPLAGSEDPVWVAQSGTAAIEPYSVTTGCPFVSEEGIAYLAKRGIRCSAGTYAVRAMAHFEPSRSASAPGHGARGLELPPVLVAGVRWTVDCAVATEWAQSCGRTTF